MNKEFILARIGNEVIIKSGRSKGLKGMVTGIIPTIRGVSVVVNINGKGELHHMDMIEVIKNEVNEVKEEVSPRAIIGVKYKVDREITWNMVGKLNMSFSIKGASTNIRTVLKILLKYIDKLKSVNYERVSPYKIIHEFDRDREDKCHVFKIKFIDLYGEVETKEILKTNSSMNLEEGEYSVFIPDLLEVAKDRGLVTLENNTYKCIEARLINIKPCAEITEMSREVLEMNGWIVPKAYEKKFELKTNK